MARKPAFSLDALDHRGFLAADIGAGAAAKVQSRVRRKPGVGDFLKFLGEEEPDLGIFVAHVHIRIRRLYHPGGNQHALDEAVRVLLEIVPILERAGLAFVGVDREQPRRRLGAHQRPFPPGRKSGTAQPAQPRVADDLDQFVARALAG